MTAKRKYKIETECLQGLIEAGASFTISAGFSVQMREHGIHLPDVRQLLEHGNVIRSDMQDHRGMWDVYGVTLDELRMVIRVAVDSEEYEIEPLAIL